MFAWLTRRAPAPTLHAERGPALPYRLALFAAACDDEARRLLIYGGGHYQRLWERPLAGRAWRELRATGGPPTATDQPALAMLAGTGAALLFGGWAAEDDAPALWPSDETWCLTPTADPSASLRAGPDGAWQRVVVHGSPPPARNGASLVCDAAGRQALLFGGDGGRRGDGRAGFAPLGDLWSFDYARTHWRRIVGHGEAPGPRWCHGADFEPETRTMFVWGGQGAGEDDPRVFAYEVARNAWRTIAPRGPRPAPRLAHGLAVVPGGLLVIGGLARGTGDPTGAASLDEAWRFDLAARRWQPLAFEGDAPGGRWGFRLLAERDAAAPTFHLLGGARSTVPGDLAAPADWLDDSVRLTLRAPD